MAISPEPYGQPPMAEQAVAPAPTGLLELPPSLLHELVISLPAKDRRALSQTCMQLAVQVLASAPNVTLRFGTRACAVSNSTRSRIISQLAATRQNFVLVVQARGPQPFPVELSSKVTEVRLVYSQAGPVSSWLDWSALTSLKSLHLPFYTTRADLDRLCEALEAGFLPQLHDLKWEWSTYGDQVYSPDGLDCERFARALGSRIQSLYVNNPEQLAYLQHLTALHSIEMAPGSLSYIQEQVAPLMNHPTLHSVTLTRWSRVELDLSQHSCKWSGLYFNGLPAPSVIFRLPIAKLEGLYIRRFLQMQDGSGITAVRYLVNNLLHKSHLVPAWMEGHNDLVFMVMGLTKDTIPIVSRLMCDCWLEVWLSSKWDAQSPAFMLAFWTALHKAVSSVRLANSTGINWSNFWKDVPCTVKRLELQSGDFYPACESLMNNMTETLCRLVVDTPRHVCSLKLYGLKESVKAACEAAGIYKVTPKHLKLELTSDWC